MGQFGVHPGEGATSQVHDPLEPLAQQVLGGAGAAGSTAADHDQFAVPGQFGVTGFQLAQGQELRALGVDFLVLAGLADIYQERALLDAALAFLRGDFFHARSIPERGTWICEVMRPVMLRGMASPLASAALTPGVTVVDLRPPELRLADPLKLNVPVRAVTLEQIEAGTHGLTPDLGPLLVVCERGVRSGLAARYLRADGLDAAHQPGGVRGLALK